MVCGDLAFFEYAVDAFQNNTHCIRTHRFHGLANGSERRSAESRRGHIVEADHGAVLRHPQTRFAQRADGAEGGHIVEGQQSGELVLLLDQFSVSFWPISKLEMRIARLGQVHNQTEIDFEAVSLWRICECLASAENCQPKSCGPRIKAILR